MPDPFDPTLLRDLRKRLADKSPVLHTTIDGYPIHENEPLRETHVQLDRYLAAVRERGINPYTEKIKPEDHADVGSLLASGDPMSLGDALYAIAIREVWYWVNCARREDQWWVYEDDGLRYPFIPLVSAIMRRNVFLPEHRIVNLCEVATYPGFKGHCGIDENQIVRLAEKSVSQFGLSSSLREALEALRRKFGPSDKLSLLLDPPAPDDELPIDNGEAWSAALFATLDAASDKTRRAWTELLQAVSTNSGSKPTKKWLASTSKYIEAVGRADFEAAVANWFSRAGEKRLRRVSVAELAGIRRHLAFNDPPSEVWSESNETALAGLAWACSTSTSPEVIRALGQLCKSAYEKLRLVGPRCARVGNAALYALTAIEHEAAAAELSRLSAIVKQPSGRKQIARSLERLATRLNITPADLEEISAQSFGLTIDGMSATRTQAVGDCQVTIRLEGKSAELLWTDGQGKSRKSMPASAKSHEPQVKALKLCQKDLDTALDAHRHRLERAFLRIEPWSLAAWRERYVDHPVVGTLARRLIWSVDGSAVMWSREGLTLVDGSPFHPSAQAQVRLWHPIQSRAEDVLAWRRRLEDMQIVQPLKQAYREVYVLTDAERHTRTYSNRFAGHILRQHQFLALAQSRGWTHQLLGGFDSQSTPTLLLKPWKLRAEYWIESAGGDGSMSPSGIFIHISMDQVRFYGITDADPLPLDQVPPLVFSEVMRDVDLFVGVASVGNDPNWQDGGPEGRYRDYWQSYSFGDLSETAKTRRVVLESLLPRLTKLKDKWTLLDKFLVIKGSIRTYKIHLGSGNILMEPNDQYLCIVPDRSSRAGEQKDVFLPFEGDATLSIILSKAFLLADDAKITDPTIKRQLK